MKREEINIRDPFVVVEDGKYYMYGTRGHECWGDAKATGLDVYVSTDLENWDGPNVCFTPPENFWADRNFWAPEVHKYEGAYYMFVSFKNEKECRGTQILKSDSPMGPFLLHSDGPVTPRDWECLDGTLFVEDGKPYMIFCHEWVQVMDGEMCAIELSADLKKAVSQPKLLFRASDPAWVAAGQDRFVTDGPFMYRTQSGKPLMVWSSFYHGEYCEAIAYAESGSILGPWVQDERLLFEKDGGHGMVFADLNGDLQFVLHRPNSSLNERPHFFAVEERQDSLYRK